MSGIGVMFSCDYTKAKFFTLKNETRIKQHAEHGHLYCITFNYHFRSIRVLPYAIMLGVGGLVAVRRLNTFYNAPDQTDMILDNGDVPAVPDEYVVYLKDATFKWPKLKKKEEEKKDDSNLLAKADSGDKAGKNETEGTTALTANNGTNGTSYGATDGDAGTSGTTDGTTTNGVMQDVSLSSDELKDDAEFLLERINMRLEKGKLYALVGSVGSGKSSLIQGILREMQQVIVFLWCHDEVVLF